MNRTDRLYALVEELRARSPRPGTLGPVNFTPSEATAIAMAVAASGTMPFSAAGRSALRKLVAAMDASDADGAAKLSGKVWVASAHPTTRHALVAPTVEGAVARGEVVRLRYRDRQGRTSDRLIEAHGITGSPRGWYLVGWCRTRNEARMFRLDRILHAEPTGEPIHSRDLEALLGWAAPVSHPVVSLVRPGIWKGEDMKTSDILARIDDDGAKWQLTLNALDEARPLTKRYIYGDPANEPRERQRASAPFAS